MTTASILYVTSGEIPLQLGPTANWVVVLCVGAIMVAFYSVSRFDEPSYDSQSEYFARYKPRFSTAYAKYSRAKSLYILAILLCYFLISLIPDLFDALFRNQAGDGPANLKELRSPLVVALAIVTLQNLPILKDGERKIRGFLHAFAQIPEGVRRTVAQMRSSEFLFDNATVVSLTRKLKAVDGAIFKTPDLVTVITNDELLHTWYCTGSVLSSLSEQNRDTIGIDSRFFDCYDEELENIGSKHAVLAEPVRQHFDAVFGSPTSSRSSASDDADAALLRELRDFRQRLYTFVACGVRSSVKTEEESAGILRKLKFTSRYTAQKGDLFAIIGPIAGLFFIAISIVSVITSFTTQSLQKTVLLPLNQGISWSAAFPVPGEPFKIYTWSLSTALFYAAAILGALAIRQTRISKREWFDINALRKERPLLRYAAPTIFGTAVGCFMLFIIALAGGPGFHLDLNHFDELKHALGEAMHVTFLWSPLAVVMSFMAVALSDIDMCGEQQQWRRLVVRSIVGGLVMALAGFLTGYITITNNVDMYAAANGIADDAAIPEAVNKAVLCVSAFIACQIALFSAILCFIVQLAERYVGHTRRLAGNTFQAASRLGALFGMTLDADGRALLLAAGRDGIDATKVLCRGQWIQFPEGTVVQWSKDNGDSRIGGDVGLISWSGGYLIYEGYADRIAGVAEFVAHLDRRATFSSPEDVSPAIWSDYKPATAA
jgi:hypothetical protein